MATIDKRVWHGLYVSPMALKPIGVYLRLSVLEYKDCQTTIMITKNTIHELEGGRVSRYPLSYAIARCNSLS